MKREIALYNAKTLVNNSENGDGRLEVETTFDANITFDEVSMEGERQPLVTVKIKDKDGRIATAFLSAKPTRNGIEFILTAKKKDNHEQTMRKATATYAQPRVQAPQA